jgi:biotin carboxyl carrier protein
MIFDFETAGRAYRLSIDPAGSRQADGVSLRVNVLSVEGEPVPASQGPAVEIVDCRPTDLGFVLRFADGRILDVAATERAGGWLIQLPRVGVAVTVDGRRGGATGAGATAATGEQRVVAPMPGRVVRVLVKPGDAVEARQGLIVVEAMKMENELTSPKAGKVKEVAVSEGGSVEAGRLLVIVE